MSRRAASAATILLVLLGCACSAGTPTGSRPSPSPSPAHEVPVPDFNGRLGSNRLAAEAAASLGRRMFAQGQYWEVYVRTQPASLKGTYDPADPAANGSLAHQVTGAEVILATESAAAIKAFAAGGEAQERAQLTALDGLLRAAFPNLAGETMRVFYGESLQHAVATFDHGALVGYDVRKLG